MKTSLPDVNFWISLASESHSHHEQARDWFAIQPEQSVAFCRVTQMGYLHLMTSRSVMRTEVKTIDEAWSSYFSLCADERVFAAQEPAGLETTWQMLMSKSGVGSSAWTDAYLAAFAATCGYLFVTLDKGFLRWGGLNCHILGQSP